MLPPKFLFHLLFTQLMKHPPICLWRGKPFTVTGTDVNVYWTETVIFLVSRCSRSRNLHVELYCVHTQYCVTNVTQHVAGRDNLKQNEPSLISHTKLRTLHLNKWQTANYLDYPKSVARPSNLYMELKLTDLTRSYFSIWSELFEHTHKRTSKTLYNVMCGGG